MGKIIERIVNADRVEDVIAVFGSFDENIKRIEESLCVSIVNRGTDLKVSGGEEEVDKALRDEEKLSAKDYFAMISSALLVFMPAAILVLLFMYFLIWIFFMR